MTAHGLERDDYEALVIGSGFGGAVTACRLAQAGIDVAIVERGRRYPAGSFPRDLTKLDAGWLWSRGQGTDAPPSDHRKSTPMKERRTMTTPTDIDRDAPVIADHEIDITAPLDRVWSLHTRVNAWPSWNQEMTGASLEGPFEAGNSFTWTSYGFTVTSTIYEVDDHSRTLWGGEAQGITGTHEWRFEPTAEGVHVTTTESFAGDPVVADTAGMQTLLDNSLVTWLGRLKTEAERH